MQVHDGFEQFILLFEVLQHVVDDFLQGVAVDGDALVQNLKESLPQKRVEVRQFKVYDFSDFLFGDFISAKVLSEFLDFIEDEHLGFVQLPLLIVLKLNEKVAEIVQSFGRALWLAVNLANFARVDS